MKSYCVYSIFNLLNGKIYIGKTNNSHKRWLSHLSTKDSHHSFSLIHRAIKKYGVDNFQFSIIQELFSAGEAKEAEKYWIEYYKSNIIKYGDAYGYNLTPGGEGTVLLGEHNPKSKLNNEQVAEIKSSNLPTKQLVNMYPVSRSTIQRIRSGEIWEKLNSDTNKKKPTDKLDGATVNSIRVLFTTTPVSIKELAEKYKVSKSLIRLILLNKSWIDPNFELNDFANQKLSRSKPGDKNSNVKLHVDLVKDIRLQHSMGVSMAEMSRKYNVSETCIYSIVHFRTWKHI